MSTDAFDDQYSIKARRVGDGRAIWLRRQMFNYAIIIGPEHLPFYDDKW